jgi:hypothetical protein
MIRKGQVRWLAKGDRPSPFHQSNPGYRRIAGAESQRPILRHCFAFATEPSKGPPLSLICSGSNASPQQNAIKHLHLPPMPVFVTKSIAIGKAAQRTGVVVDADVLSSVLLGHFRRDSAASSSFFIYFTSTVALKHASARTHDTSGYHCSRSISVSNFAG